MALALLAWAEPALAQSVAPPLSDERIAVRSLEPRYPISTWRHGPLTNPYLTPVPGSPAGTASPELASHSPNGTAAAGSRKPRRPTDPDARGRRPRGSFRPTIRPTLIAPDVEMPMSSRN